MYQDDVCKCADDACFKILPLYTSNESRASVVFIEIFDAEPNQI